MLLFFVLLLLLLLPLLLFLPLLFAAIAAGAIVLVPLLGDLRHAFARVADDSLRQTYTQRNTHVGHVKRQLVLRARQYRHLQRHPPMGTVKLFLCYTFKSDYKKQISPSKLSYI